MIELRVLIADDDPAVRLLLEAMLEQVAVEGHNVTCEMYANGKQAYAAWHERPNAYALVISDGVMPGMLGVEFVKKIKEERPDQKIIFCSGTEGVQGKADASFQKPIKTDEFIKTAQKLLLDYTTILSDKP
ncbi:MAG: response regulator [Candidatus Woesearchaeota archaeon]|nr:response regulator [Candidatus Woesearchaeota archaeon]